jgi:hypothetical protein
MKNGSDFYPVGSSCCMNAQTDKTFGDWRLQYLLMADNRENGRFVEIDAEAQYSIARQTNPEINFNKAYMDSYPKVVTAGGERFPAMVNAIDANIQRGVLVANYIGHGGEAGLADERVVAIDQINSWSNINLSIPQNMRAVFFINKDTGFIVGENARIQKTMNGGSTWSQKYVRTAAYGYDIHFRGQYGIAVGKDMLAVSSNNMGETWAVDTTFVSNKRLNSACILPNGQCWAVGDSGYILNKHISRRLWVNKKYNSKYVFFFFFIFIFYIKIKNKSRYVIFFFLYIFIFYIYKASRQLSLSRY